MIAVQHDQVAIIGEEANSLSVPRYIENRTWLRFEYVFDNTVDIRQNIRKGTRFKAYADLFKPVAIKTDSVFKVDFSGGVTANIGFDFRYYKPLDKKTIFALRVAGASSFGKDKILYSLGGIENWLFPSTDQLIPLPQQDNFAYQTLAAPLRGFSNNIRNGSSFLVANAELRIPIADYLNLTSARSSALRTLQLVPFFDIGTAWQGISPFSADNPLNTSIIDRSSAGTISPIRVRVNYYRQPIVMGFGFGLRAAVSGYFLRADLGFGVETGLVRTPKLQFGIGTDF
jgi:outer membrane protein assembly factor BamA